MKSLSKPAKILIMIISLVLAIAILGGSIFGIAYGYLNRNTIKIDFDDTKEFQSFHNSEIIIDTFSKDKGNNLSETSHTILDTTFAKNTKPL